MEKYIHFTSFNIDTINSIFKNGIRSKHNLKKIGIKVKNDIDFNGEYFISLTKENELNTEYVFNKYYNDMNYIGIEVNEPKKIYKSETNNINDILYSLFNNTKIPIRYSSYPDEWQTKKNIYIKDIVALKYRIEHFKEIGNIKEKLLALRILVDEYNKNIPIIDFDTNKVYEIK